MPQRCVSGFSIHSENLSSTLASSLRGGARRSLSCRSLNFAASHRADVALQARQKIAPCVRTRRALQLLTFPLPSVWLGRLVPPSRPSGVPGRKSSSSAFALNSCASRRNSSLANRSKQSRAAAPHQDARVCCECHAAINGHFRRLFGWSPNFEYQAAARTTDY